MARKLIDRTGEASVTNSGISMTIITYRNNRDIDVQFETGQIAKHRNYFDFKGGRIKCPMLFEYIDDYVKVTNLNTKPVFSFLIDKEDVGILGDSLWCKNGKGYATSRIDGKMQLLHRLIMQASPEVQVDHKNCDESDCRKANLRKCINAENQRNKIRQSNNTSGYKGVSWDIQAKKYQAYISINRKKLHLGYFDSLFEAARAYDKAAIKYHGEFARLNDLSA